MTGHIGNCNFLFMLLSCMYVYPHAHSIDIWLTLYYSIFSYTYMRFCTILCVAYITWLSMLCPTSPGGGMRGGRWGFDAKTRPTGGDFDLTGD